MTTMTQIPNSEKLIANASESLDIGQTSGSMKISIPFLAEYIMVQNDTIATLYIEIGETFQKSNNSQIFTPGKYISLPIVQPTQKLSVFWESNTPIGADSNLVQFMFSNVTIPLSGGNYGSTSTSQDVEVMNTVTTQFASTPNVNVLTLPENPLEVAISNPLPEGTNNIGKFDINSLPAVQTEANTADVLTVASAAITATTTSADIDVSKLTELALDVNLTAFGGADNTYQLIVNRKGLDGVYYPLYTGTTITNTIQAISVSLGHPNNQSLGNIIQVVETIGGTTPSITRSMSIIGK